MPHDFVHRLHLVEVVYGNLPSEHLIHLSLRIIDRYIAFAHNDGTVAFLPGIIDHELCCLVGDILTADNLVADETQGSVDGNPAVDEMFDGSQVSDDEGRAASSDIHLVTVGLSLRQGQDGGWGNLMGVETHQRTVDIEE